MATEVYLPPTTMIARAKYVAPGALTRYSACAAIEHGVKRSWTEMRSSQVTVFVFETAPSLTLQRIKFVFIAVRIRPRFPSVLYSCWGELDAS